MTPMQHRAVLVCILCVLAVLLTFGITTTLLKKGGACPPLSRSLQRDPLPPAKTCRATTRSTTPPPPC